MRPGLQRRIARLESAVVRKYSVSSGPVTVRSFQAQVEERIRITLESFEEGFQALVARLRDDELEALILEAEATSTPSCLPAALHLPAGVQSLD
jgi:hypothetical protein